MPSIMAEFADIARTLDLSVTDSSFDGHRLDIALPDAGSAIIVHSGQTFTGHDCQSLDRSAL